MAPQWIQAGNPDQIVRILIDIEDGDGDIGFEQGNLFFTDSRDTSVQKLSIPVIPASYSPKRGISGTMQVDFRAAFLTLRPDTAHLESDTLRWSVYMIDEAGNRSNTIFTDSLYLFK